MTTNNKAHNTMSGGFLSVDNLKTCMKVFHKYMTDKYDFDIHSQGRELNLKKLMYEVMLEIENQYGTTMQLTDKNNVVLNIVRDHYKSNFKLSKSAPKPHLHNLDREQQAFGKRAVNSVQLKPESTTERRSDSVENDFKSLQSDREKESDKTQPAFAEPVSENAMERDDFETRMKELSKSRDLTSFNTDRLEQDTEMAQRTIIDVNPQDMYKQQEKAIAVSQATTVAPLRQDFVVQPTKNMYSMEKYVCINGFDRDWTLYPNRFSFAADFGGGFNNDVQQRYRNVRSLTVKRIILPQEIRESSSINNVPKSSYLHSFSFTYPYVFLQIDELNNYDGTNDTVRRGFAQMIVDKCYTAPNGRGFLVLQTMQDERKVFYPTPLSELQRMTFSIRKPNGELFNTSRDYLKIFKIEYDMLNSKYLKIVTNLYFDKNEFYKGDTVVIRDYAVTKIDQTMTDAGISQLNNFINRSAGHTILEMGEANDSGFYRNFYIKAPGAFDETCGKFVVDSVIIPTLNKYNDAYNFVANPSTVNGSILNTALQCILTFKVEMVVPDPGTSELSV